MSARQKPASAPGVERTSANAPKRRHGAHRGGNRHSGDLPAVQESAAQADCSSSVCAGVVKVTIAPLRLYNPLNTRQGWRTVWRRGKAEKDRVRWAMAAVELPIPVKPTVERPWVVTVTRCGPGALDSHDALPASAKHVVDAVAEWIGVDDKRSDLVAYRYAQRREREWSVEICVEARRGKD